MEDVLREQTAARRFHRGVANGSIFRACVAACGGRCVRGDALLFVTQRIPEIGVRMVFGACGKDIVRSSCDEPCGLLALDSPSD